MLLRESGNRSNDLNNAVAILGLFCSAELSWLSCRTPHVLKQLIRQVWQMDWAFCLKHTNASLSRKARSKPMRGGDPALILYILRLCHFMAYFRFLDAVLLILFY